MIACSTLASDTPSMLTSEVVMYGAFGIRPLALLVLIRPGGTLDEYFGFTGTAAAQFSDATYGDGYAGAIQANYFRENLQRRGLIDSSSGPPLKSFPFYEDGAPIFDSIRTFTGSFVDSYYSSDRVVTADTELQNFVTEANGPAGVIDFPATLSTRSNLADFLAEFARLTSISHHAVNLNQLITASATLPFHPTALYKPVPTAKGVTDVASFLPPLEKCLGIIEVSANFARPLLASTNRSIVHMFDDPVFLSRSNAATRAANAQFMAAMRARSQVVRSRSFDGDGLSQGMPFVWQALDPDVAPWSLSI